MGGPSCGAQLHEHVCKQRCPRQVTNVGRGARAGPCASTPPAPVAFEAWFIMYMS